jgi:HK97 family phage portal protein
MLRNLFNPRESERALSYQSIFAAGADIAPRTWSGTVINQDTSLKLGAVYACVRLLSDTISTLPADTFIRRDGDRVPFRPRPEWVMQPDIGVSREDHIQQVMVSLLIDGNAFIRIFRNARGEVAALVVLDPSRIKVQRNRETREVEFVYEDKTIIPRREMLHITELRKPGALRGVSRIDEVKQTLGRAAALEEFSARFFGQGSVMSGLIETPAIMNSEQALELKNAFETTHKGVNKSHRIGVLGGGAKFTKTSIDPDEAQMLESRQFAVEEIARIFRVPLHLLQVATPGAMSYASVEQNAIQFAQYTLRPYVSKLETAYSSLIPSEGFLRFNLDAILRGDLQTRFSAYSTAMQSGFLSINDIHRLEDMRPVDGGDEYRVPLANVNLGAANIVETEKRVLMAQRLILAGFDPSQVMQAVGLPNVAHTGLPSVQLQGIAQIDPEQPESAYPVRDLDPEEFTSAIREAISSMQPPVVNVNVPESRQDKQRARTRKIERDDQGNIIKIHDEQTTNVERDDHGNITGIVEE